MSQSSIAGKTVVITGAASGIGRALALGFLADGARVIGADVAEVGLDAVAAAGGLIVRTDVSDPAQVQRLVDTAAAETGRIDVLFNNAGIGGRGTIEGMSDGAFERFVAVHLFGTFYGLRAAMPLMRAQGYGRVINTLSRGAELRQAGWAAYGSAKAGMLALTRIAAAEVAGTDILINGMIPGPTQSGMNKGAALQDPSVVYPWALKLATLPAAGPPGQVFWNGENYWLFAEPPEAARS